MTVFRRTGLAGISVTLLATTALAVGQADATPSSTVTVIFPAGTACDFNLKVDITGGPQVNKTFTSRDGTIRVLSAGKGSDLVFTNLDNTTHTLDLPGNGAVSWSREASGQDTRLTLTGHNVVFLFPTDNPPGPSTTLVVGREVIAVDSSSNFNVLSQTGTTTDICAALGP